MRGAKASRAKAAPALVTLGSTHLARREPARATEVYRRPAALAPQDPRAVHLVGVGLLAQGKRAEGRKELEAALAPAPGLVDPLTQLVALSFAEKQPNQALERVNRQAALPPRSATHRFLLGEAHLARRESKPAGAAYLEAIALDPRLAGPYLQLGSLYAASGQFDQALAKVGEALEVNAKNVGALRPGGKQPGLDPLRARRRQGQGARPRPDRQGAGAGGAPRLRHARLDPLPARRASARAGPPHGARRRASTGGSPGTAD